MYNFRIYGTTFGSNSGKTIIALTITKFVNIAWLVNCYTSKIVGWSQIFKKLEDY